MSWQDLERGGSGIAPATTSGSARMSSGLSSSINSSTGTATPAASSASNSWTENTRRTRVMVPAAATRDAQAARRPASRSRPNPGARRRGRKHGASRRPVPRPAGRRGRRGRRAATRRRCDGPDRAVANPRRARGDAGRDSRAPPDRPRCRRRSAEQVDRQAVGPRRLADDGCDVGALSCEGVVGGVSARAATATLDGVRRDFLVEQRPDQPPRGVLRRRHRITLRLVHQRPRGAVRRPCRADAAVGRLPSPIWAGIGSLVVGRHVFDVTNGWEGTPPAGDHNVVVSHRLKPDGWHPEAAVPLRRGRGRGRCQGAGAGGRPHCRSRRRQRGWAGRGF